MLPFALALCKVGEVLDGLRRVFFEQAADYIALGSIESCVCTRSAGHEWILSGVYEIAKWTESLDHQN